MVNRIQTYVEENSLETVIETNCNSTEGEENRWKFEYNRLREKF